MAAALALAGCGGGSSTPPDPTLAQTQQGAVKGTAANGVVQFLGVPYAAAPTGALRWKAPAPAPARAAVLETKTAGAQCLQAGPPPTFTPSGSEDCLFLNIYRPEAAPAAPLPVIVAIHGGGFVLGSSAFQDGTSLAKNNNVILVSINYRLSALGFLAHPALTAENAASGNYGLMDQNAALAWVKQNISAFGGDPANVTITGGSAGGLSVFSHMASPMSSGLFAKAAPQSGGFSRLQATLAQSEAAGVSFAAPWTCNSAGTNAQIAACLRALPATTTLVGAVPPPIGGTGNLSAWLPIVDGKFLTTSTSLAFSSGNFAKVPLMTGVVEDEGTFFVSAAFGQAPLSAATYEPVGIAGFLGLANPTAVSALYPPASYATPNQALARVYGDFRVTCGILQDTDNIANALPATAKAYVYQFSEKAPYTNALSLANRLPPNNNITYGAFHGADVNYWFDQMTSPTTPAQLQLAQTMSKAFANFAKSGNPNVDGTLPQWQAYSASQRGVLNLTHAASTANVDAYGAHQCGFWYGQPPSTRL
ncbi:MAG: carboxylesterase family protein [Burkholderiales bacterium]|nr:carboxylesterase family protein [Burkholderiales bacterium]